MKNKLFIISIIFFQLSCLSYDAKKNLVQQNSDYFSKKAKLYYSYEKYFLLNKLSNLELKKFPDNFVAAYYKAYSTQKNNNLAGLDYYINYIENHSNIPDDYKEKWLELALNIENCKAIKFENLGINFYNDIINLQTTSNSKNFCKPKILENISNYFYLNTEGSLFIIKKITKEVKKINYYKTRDFIVIDDYVIFNDSINLLKYKFEENKYYSVHTFNEDEIYFQNVNPKTHSAIVKHIESNDYIIKYINFEKNIIQNLPNNCIAQSSNYLYIVIEYSDRFEIFDIQGNYLLSINGEFIGFGIDSNDIYLYKDNHLCFYDFKKQQIKKIIYIPQFKEKKGFKAISSNKILFCFDNYMLEVIFTRKKINLSLLKGELIHIFKSGYMYKNNEDNNVYFFSFFNNSKNLIFQNNDILKNMVFPDNKSSIFLIKNNNNLIINNLNDFFP